MKRFDDPENPFERQMRRYEQWYANHPAIYRAELAAVRMGWPTGCDGVEIGSGAGHFAAPLGIQTCVEPAAAMRSAALKRGVSAIDAVAEALPFRTGRFDAALMVNTLCFVTDVEQSLLEMFRVVRAGGCAVVGFIDREGVIGRAYAARQDESVFYRKARFLAAREVVDAMNRVGFRNVAVFQTLFGAVDEEEEVPETVKRGFGEGSFVVVRGVKPDGADPC